MSTQQIARAFSVFSKPLKVVWSSILHIHMLLNYTNVLQMWILSFPTKSRDMSIFKNMPYDKSEYTDITIEKMCHKNYSTALNAHLGSQEVLCDCYLDISISERCLRRFWCVPWSFISCTVYNGVNGKTDPYAILWDGDKRINSVQ